MHIIFLMIGAFCHPGSPHFDSTVRSLKVCLASSHDDVVQRILHSDISSYTIQGYTKNTEIGLEFIIVGGLEQERYIGVTVAALDPIRCHSCHGQPCERCMGAIEVLSYSVSKLHATDIHHVYSPIGGCDNRSELCFCTNYAPHELHKAVAARVPACNVLLAYVPTDGSMIQDPTVNYCLHTII